MSNPVKTHRNALSQGASLLWYHIERVLGQGAFGITYLATDGNLHRAVAIKEYLPSQYAHREGDGSVMALTDDLAQDYAVGLKRFIAEARTLAKFEHPSIVRVHNVFEANRTAYMVMHYEEGEGLDRILAGRGTLTEFELLRILHPLLAGLEVIHAQGFVHRDIKPANIFIRRDGSPVLLDFGSAREAMTGEARTLTNFVSPGYAPIEQYAGKSDKQGPWSDIYGLGATLYRAMTGRAPPDAVERSRAIAQDTRDSFETGASRAKQAYSAALLAAVDLSLRFHATERPLTVAEWRRLLPSLPAGADGMAAPVDTQAATRAGTRSVEAPTLMQTLPPTTLLSAGPVVADASSVAPPSSRTSGRSGRSRWPLIAGASVLLLGAAVVGGRWLAHSFFSVTPGSLTAPAPPAQPVPAQAAIQAPAVAAGSAAAPPPAATTAPRSAAARPQPTPAPAPAARNRDVERVQELLLGASRDVDARRLMSPPGQNAYEKYREVLALQPGNQAALRGIESIADSYAELTERAIGSGDLAQAQSHLLKAEALAPDHPPVVAARGALDAAQARASAAPASAPPAVRGKLTREQRNQLRRQRWRNRQ